MFDLQPSIQIAPDQMNGRNQFYCFGDSLKFGLNGAGVFGLFAGYDLLWKPTNSTTPKVEKWMFSSVDGNIKMILEDKSEVFAATLDTPFESFAGSVMTMDGKGLQISKDGEILWQLDAESLKAQKSESSLICVTPVSAQWSVQTGNLYEAGDVLCLRDGYKFGVDEEGRFGFFLGSDMIWSPSAEPASKWIWQNDGNLVVYSSFSTVVWASMKSGNYRDADGAELILSTEGLRIQKNDQDLWELRFYDECLLTTYDDVQLVIPVGKRHRTREFYCIQEDDTTHRLGIDENGEFGYFIGSENIWKPNNMNGNIASGWRFQSDGNLIVLSSSDVVYASRWDNQYNLTAGSEFIFSTDGLAIENNATTLWSADFGDVPVGRFAEGECMNEVVAFDSSIIFIPVEEPFQRGYFHCLRGETYKFGLDERGNFGYFVNSELIWKPSNKKNGVADYWIFQEDGNIVLRSGTAAIWASDWESQTAGNVSEAELLVTTGGLSILNDGSITWSVSLRDTSAERGRLDSRALPSPQSLRGRGNGL
ncbi:MAG: hypothetical protein SGILL_004758 [Bacillariaceae sp.]